MIKTDQTLFYIIKISDFPNPRIDSLIIILDYHFLVFQNSISIQIFNLVVLEFIRFNRGINSGTQMLRIFYNKML